MSGDVRRTAAVIVTGALLFLTGCSGDDAPGGSDAAPTTEAAEPAEVSLAVADGSGDVSPIVPLEIAVTGGRIDQVTAAARQRGTTIAVRALFFNTPARRKFLRSVSSESRVSGDAVTVLALAHPGVGFELISDERSRLHLPAGQPLAERLAAVWGRDVAGTMIPVSHAVGSVRVEGFIQRPGDARPTGRRTQLLVNGRPFKDNFLIRAAEAGYRSAIHPGDRPSLFLHLWIGAGDVEAVLLNLGGGDGLVTDLGGRWPDLPVIVVTAPGGRAHGFALRGSGAWDYLEPPGDLGPERLVSVLAGALARRRLVRELRAAQGTGPETLNLESRERQAIVAALETTRWNKQAAARLLGLHRPTLYAKMRKHGIPQARPH